MQLAVTWRYCVALFAMTMLYSSVHELAHHAAGFAVCGAWGYKSFNYFRTACEGQDATDWFVSYVGPAFSFGAMWFGWWMMSRPGASQLRRQTGYATIFAQMPAQRMSGPLFGMNDEYYAAAKLFGAGWNTRLVTLAVILLCTVPPLVAAWRAIANHRRTAWFLLFFLLLPYLIWGPVFVLLEYLLVTKHVLDGRTIGITNLFILNEVVTLVLFWYTRHWFDTSRAPARRHTE